MHSVVVHMSRAIATAFLKISGIAHDDMISVMASCSMAPGEPAIPVPRVPGYVAQSPSDGDVRGNPIRFDA